MRPFLSGGVTALTAKAQGLFMGMQKGGGSKKGWRKKFVRGSLGFKDLSGDIKV